MREEPKSPRWHCFKCKVEMESVNTIVSYRGVSDAAKGLRCPRCGVRYIPEETVVEIIAKLEEAIDKKEA